jgi:plastocyanin
MATQSIQSIITSTLNKGDKGDLGAKGDKGVYITAATYALANDTVTFTNSDASTIDLTGIKGAKGNTGDTGSTGEKGIKGEIGDLTSITGVSESFVALTSATGTVTHDTTSSSIFVHSSISANFTANFTNVATTNLRAKAVVLILNQGGTAYMPTAIQIDGVSQTIKWAGGVVPAGTANGVNVVTFTLIRASSAWTVVAQASMFI